MTAALGRRALAELLGTAVLVMAIIGSGIAATRLSPGQTGLQLLENSLVTGAALVALILALQPLSAAFNPIITLAERVLGVLGTRDSLVVIAGQLVGGLFGAVLANLMFGLPAISLATQNRGGAGVWLAEVIATAGLVLIIFGAARGGRTDRLAYAVGAYIAAAYWFTSSTSFANPAVTIARIFSDSFAGIAPSSVPPFLIAQLVGGAVGFAIVRYLYPSSSPLRNVKERHDHELDRRAVGRR